jgi:hypothetical protein
MIWIPKLLMALVAPLAAAAVLSSFFFPMAANRVWWAITGRTGDATDDVVWSNAFYPLAAFAALPDMVTFAIVWGAGVALAACSAAYHSTYARWAQRADVAAVMTYLVVVNAAILSPVTAQVWTIVPVAAATYSARTWQIDSHVHGPVWAALAIGLLAWQAGWIGLVAPVPVAAGIAVDQWVGGGQPDHPAHGAWHLGGALSVAIALFLI